MDGGTDRTTAPPPPGDSEVDKDVDRLFSDQTVTVKGEELTVREFRYLEGLRAAAIARPFIAGLRRMIERGAGSLELEAIDALIADNHEAWLQLLSMASDRPVEWFKDVPDSEGLALSMALWNANSRFFTRRLVLGAALKVGLEDLMSRSRRSSRSSSPQDSAATTEKSASA